MMRDLPPAAPDPDHRTRGWARATVIVLACTSIALLLSVNGVFEGLQRLLTVTETLIAAHPYLGAATFVLFTAVSAMLAFFSNAPLLPAAVFAWGNTATLGLLWIGWLLGGICTYALGRGLRKPQGRASENESGASRRIDFYLQRVPARLTFSWALLLNLALPSEIPGYVCGYVGVRFRTYILALALAELPYALGAVLLANGVVNRNTGALVALGIAVAALGLYAFRVLHERLEHS